MTPTPDQTFESEVDEILQELLWGEHDDERKAISEAKAAITRKYHSELERIPTAEQYLTAIYGERCGFKDTEEFPELQDDPSYSRCPVCQQWEMYDEWLAGMGDKTGGRKGL